MLSKRFFQKQYTKSTKQDLQRRTWPLFMLFSLHFSLRRSSTIFLYSLISSIWANYDLRNENSYDVLECKSDHDLQKSESASFQRSKDIQKNRKRKKRTKNRTWIDALRFIHAFVYLIQLSKLTGSRLTNCLGNRASLDKQNIFFLIVHYFSKAYIFWILFILFSTEIQRCSQAILFINLYL